MIFFIFTIIFLAIIVLLYMWKEAFRNVVVFDHVYVPSLPSENPVRLFFISDIHRRVIHPSIIQKMKDNVDVIIIGGDLAEKGVPLERIQHNVRKLSSIAPVFFVWGNNDYEVDVLELKKILMEENVTILKNTSITFPLTGGKRIRLIGVDDLSNGNADKNLAFKEVVPTDFNILISHNPYFIKKLQTTDPIHLMLSGHTHGGQIRLFGLGLYEKGGWFQHHQTKYFVSNGYGTTALPLRFGAKAETHLITISNRKKPEGISI
ncbi:putative MPP superfamily phosphohydrolase [Oikeobacillus pervagus]|uniref:MPP superfamily phosphohydrolase n=1 Tax=Oikeobacillus pervagus TaxID=1325931 RepID=A0AAJ1WFA7_9BACI|nr:metallophosphoesterase [Oikeobacillus pervagus]MDQ0213722.1 putative MPP superfamily phosphohydrolase [Oikeobacillus pervagus]